MTHPATRAGRGAIVAAAALAPLLVTSSHLRSNAAPPLRTFQVRAGNVSLRTVRAGQGTTLVLLHGYGESLLAWREVFQILSRNADVVAFDLPGFGLSSKPPEGYAVESLATTVVRALDALSVRRAILIGHSLGGAVAAAVALSHPSRVSALVLVDPAVVALGWPVATARAESGPATRRVVADYERLRARLAGAHDPDWIAEPETALAYNPADDPAYHTALQAVLREFDFTYFTPERAKRLAMPVLVLWGAYDPVVPLRAGSTFAAALPNSRLEVIPRAWHRPHEERPADVAGRIAAFLGRGAAPGTHSAP